MVKNPAANSGDIKEISFESSFLNHLPYYIMAVYSFGHFVVDLTDRGYTGYN